jgi:hypothetical protein
LPANPEGPLKKGLTAYVDFDGMNWGQWTWCRKDDVIASAMNGNRKEKEKRKEKRRRNNREMVTTYLGPVDTVQEG